MPVPPQIVDLKNSASVSSRMLKAQAFKRQSKKMTKKFKSVGRSISRTFSNGSKKEMEQNLKESHICFSDAEPEVRYFERPEDEPIWYETKPADAARVNIKTTLVALMQKQGEIDALDQDEHCLRGIEEFYLQKPSAALPQREIVRRVVEFHQNLVQQQQQQQQQQEQGNKGKSKRRYKDNEVEEDPDELLRQHARGCSELDRQLAKDLGQQDEVDAMAIHGRRRWVSRSRSSSKSESMVLLSSHHTRNSLNSYFSGQEEYSEDSNYVYDGSTDSETDDAVTLDSN